jgi:hypothetical protein
MGKLVDAPLVQLYLTMLDVLVDHAPLSLTLMDAFAQAAACNYNTKVIFWLGFVDLFRNNDRGE